MVAPEPIFEPRGTPLSVVGRLKALSDLGHSVDLLTYSIGEDVSFPNLRIFRVPRVPGIRKIKIGPSVQKIPLDFLLAVKTFFHLLKYRYDVLHTHEEAGFWGAGMSKFFQIPHLYDMHSSLPQQLENFQFSKSKLLIKLFHFLEKRVILGARGVIVICPELKNYVDALLSHPNVRLIENVVDYGMIFGESDSSPRIRTDYALAGKKVILYTGTFEPYQGLDLLVRSAYIVIQQIPDSVFMLVGGHPGQVSVCRQKVSECGLEKHFVLTGQVRPEDVNSYIRCADALVSPRTAGNNTPLKIYAYLRSGIPIVATRLITHTQVLDDTVSMLSGPDPESFADGILSVLSDRKLSASLSRNAAVLAGKRYSYPVYLGKLSAVVDQTAGRR